MEHGRSSLAVSDTASKDAPGKDAQLAIAGREGCRRREVPDLLSQVAQRLQEMTVSAGDTGVPQPQHQCGGRGALYLHAFSLSLRACDLHLVQAGDMPPSPGGVSASALDAPCARLTHRRTPVEGRNEGRSISPEVALSSKKTSCEIL